MKKVFIAIVLIIAVFAILRISSPEDSWICVDGSWTKHGNPTDLPPEGGCGTDMPKTSDFAEIGHFVINNPGMDPGVWYLVYERPAEPALYAKLSFDTYSECIFNGRPGECPDVLLLSSALTNVWGTKQADGSILVTKAVSGDIPQ